MPFDQQDCRQEAIDWISQFNDSITMPNNGKIRIQGLFLENSFWRDALGLTWQIETYSGSRDVTSKISESAAKIGLSNLRLDDDASSPQWVNRAGTDAIEAFVKFETNDAHGRGIVRLCEATEQVDTDAAGPTWRAWTFFTAIDSLKGHEEQTGRNRPTGSSYSRDFRGPNWLDERIVAQQYDDRDPAVLVVGGGQAGLSIAVSVSTCSVASHNLTMPRPLACLVSNFMNASMASVPARFTHCGRLAS